MSRDGARGGARPSVVSHAQVAAQFAGIALAAAPIGDAPQPLAWPTALAIAPVVAGAALGACTLAHNRIGNFRVHPEPKHGARLVTSGPYRWIRHPMYSALMLVMLGAAAWNGHALNWAGLVLVVAAVVAKAAREERLLPAQFADYEAYRARTRRFVPYLF